MRNRTKVGLSAAAVLAGVLGVATFATLEASEKAGRLPEAMRDLSGAREIQVRDSSDQVVLHGAFEPADEEGERKAALASSSGTGRGEAEIEPIGKDAPGFELEVDVEGLLASASYAIHVDGAVAGTLTTNADGKGEIELTSGGDR